MKVKIYFLFRALSKTTELGLKTVSLLFVLAHSSQNTSTGTVILFFFFEIRVSRQYLSSTSKVTKFCLRQVVGLYQTSHIKHLVYWLPHWYLLWLKNIIKIKGKRSSFKCAVFLSQKADSAVKSTHWTWVPFAAPTWCIYVLLCHHF